MSATLKDSKGDLRYFAADDADELLEQAMSSLEKLCPPETHGEDYDAEHIQNVLYEFHARLIEQTTNAGEGFNK